MNHVFSEIKNDVESLLNFLRDENYVIYDDEKFHTISKNIIY